jgi:hypothetical protein
MTAVCPYPRHLPGLSGVVYGASGPVYAVLGGFQASGSSCGRYGGLSGLFRGSGRGGFQAGGIARLTNPGWLCLIELFKTVDPVLRNARTNLQFDSRTRPKANKPRTAGLRSVGSSEVAGFVPTLAEMLAWGNFFPLWCFEPCSAGTSASGGPRREGMAQGRATAQPCLILPLATSFWSRAGCNTGRRNESRVGSGYHCSWVFKDEATDRYTVCAKSNHHLISGQGWFVPRSLTQPVCSKSEL